MRQNCKNDVKFKFKCEDSFYILWGTIKNLIVLLSMMSRDDIFLYLKGSKLVDDLCLKKCEFVPIKARIGTPKTILIIRI